MPNSFPRAIWSWTTSGLLTALISCVVFSSSAGAQGELGGIEGRVQDSSGLPLVGALVRVQSAETSLRERFVFTDHVGAFSVPDLVAGKYLVRVTKSNFLPTVSSDVNVLTGVAVALTLNLQTPIDIISQGIRRNNLEDMMWVLRSSPSNRPILRLVEKDVSGRERSARSVFSGMEASGYLQLYSTSMEVPAGGTDSVGSRFSLSVPLAVDSQVTFAGQYVESDNQPRGFGATYEFSPAEHHSSSLAVRLRQGALLNGELQGPEGREVRIEYGERLQWSDDLVLDYGTSAGRAEGIDSLNYLRPRFGLTWTPQSRTAIQGSFSRQTPRDSVDEIRGREFFERAVYIPPELEHYRHAEVGASQVLSEAIRVSAVLFQDELGTQAFLVDADNGLRAIMFFDAADAKVSGTRLSLDGVFPGFEAGVGYTFASGLGFDPNVVSPDDLQGNARTRNFHVVTARVKADIEATHTAVTAVYRWASGFSLAPIDPYQRFAEYNDPTLSVTIAQDLPSLSILPAKVQAIVDARNLFEPSFGSRRTVHAAYPRLFKGGIHFTF